MPRAKQQPTVHSGDHPSMKETIYRHPAFGQIGVSRVEGGTHLYGTDFEHRGYVVIRITASEERRSLSRDWHYNRENLIEVALSHAQWATFVSSFNVGSGVPCTIQVEGGKYVPGIEPIKTEEEQFKGEVDQTLVKSRAELEALENELKDLTAGISNKMRDRLLSRVRMARQHIDANLPYVAKSFDKHVEKKVEQAKVEIHGYMNATLQRAGLEALQAAGTDALSAPTNTIKLLPKHKGD